MITEDCTPTLGENVEIDLKCAEKVTDSDIDDTEDIKATGKNHMVILFLTNF